MLNNIVFTFDNRWMMFYNLFLIWRYQVHVNEKICAIVKVVKYIHKYIYKKEDQITLQINKNDEITKHINDRYINLSQVAWKLFEYSSHQEWLSIHRLLVYLFKQQSMYFDLELFSKELQHCIKLLQFEFMIFFKYNQFHAKKRQFLYQNWSIHYI